ncbi:CHAT domain-containing protein [Mycena polygramma]|nr:CHAT domain-containing protein [Mycena polygramma]
MLDYLIQAVCIHKDTVWKDSTNPWYLGHLGRALYDRFQQRGNLDDIHEAISVQRSVLNQTPDSHPNMPDMLTNLANSLGARFKQLDSLDDLTEWIKKQEKAVHLTKDGHPEQPARLSNLGNSLVTRFDKLGQLEDLNTGISKHEEALRWSPDHHPYKSTWLSNLGGSLLTRFYRFGDLGDLNESISRQEEAVKLTPDNNLNKPDLLNNLGVSLETRFGLLKNISDLQECISRQEDAIDLTPEGHPGMPLWLTSLGNALRSRFERLNNLNDLELAISKHQAAVRLVSDDSPQKYKMLKNLGDSLRTRSKRFNSLDNLNECISLHKDAVSCVPDGHPDKPIILVDIGEALLGRYIQCHDPDDVGEMIVQYKSAACSPTGPASARFHAAIMWAGGADILEQTSLGLEAYNVAFNLLPELAWLGLSINDRHREIRRADTLARNAAVIAISAGQPAKAVEWLEQGRSIIWGQLLNLRTPVDQLKQDHSELAKEFLSLSNDLERATIRSSSRNQTPASIAQHIHEKAHRRDVLLKQIRKLKGFHRFLLPKTMSELSSASQKGPVVLLNAGDESCDALILMSGEMLHITLPEFTPEHVESLAKSLERLIPYMGRSDIDRLPGRREGGSKSLETDFEHILSELWVRAVKPVLHAIGITTPRKDNWPRIWWCPNGRLTFFPIHAAGLYGKDIAFGSKLADFAISSYTPSLTALIQGFRSTSQLPEELQILAVAQPSAAGQKFIPGTKDEIHRIQQSVLGMIQVHPVFEHEATIARVEEAMRKCSWVHFACHGVQDATTPTESALLLAGDSRLMLSRIIQLNLPNADFAFLSACQTATGDRNLQEEAIHLAAGMLLAGYRGVIATMWSIMDNDAPQVAEDVYTHLFKTSPPDSTRAAEALHIAVQILRESVGMEGEKKSLFHWVPFIHVGV